MEIKAILNSCQGLAILKQSIFADEIEREIFAKHQNKYLALLKNALYLHLAELSAKRNATDDVESLLTLLEEYPEMRQSMYQNYWKLVETVVFRSLKKRPDLILRVKQLWEKENRPLKPYIIQQDKVIVYSVQEVAV